MTWRNDLSDIREETTVYWFRRDLRIKDNAALYHALKDNVNVVPIFIFDTQILDKLDDTHDARVEFILESLVWLQKELVSHGSSLLVLYGDPVKLFTEMRTRRVYANRDYEPYAITRDQAVARMLEAR